MKLETITSEDLADDDTELEKETPGAPKPPPRYKRKVKLRGVEDLNLETVNLTDDQEGTHQNDIFFNVSGSHQSLVKQKELVEGNNIAITGLVWSYQLPISPQCQSLIPGAAVLYL